MSGGIAPSDSADSQSNRPKVGGSSSAAGRDTVIRYLIPVYPYRTSVVEEH